jgi:hypothetical protein
VGLMPDSFSTHALIGFFHTLSLQSSLDLLKGKAVIPIQGHPGFLSDFAQEAHTCLVLDEFDRKPKSCSQGKGIT